MDNLVMRVSPVFVEAHIADIHFGAINPEIQYNILKEQFLNVIDSMDTLDIVSINGDIFHHKFMANSNAIMYACYFITQLIDICYRHNSTLIIIAGTYEHDSDQLKLFYPYINNRVDIRIVEEVKFEYVRGKRILVIPELYGKGKEYYNKFLFYSGYYDAVYMHGTYKGSIYGKDIGNLDSDREPVFEMNDFVNCLGPIISGHVHTPGCFDSYFYYCGSPYRWKFGEEEDKGFIILLHNIRTREHYINFEPIYSFRYDTINLDSMIMEDPNTIIQYIKNLQANGIDNIRIQFTKNNENTLNILKTYYRSNPNVKIDSNIKNEQVLKEEQELSNKYKEYDYLFDTGSSPEEKLVKYINQNKGEIFITVDDLVNILKSI